MELRGIRGGRGVTAAVLALEGATLRELARASTMAAALAGRSILVAVDGGLRACRAARRTADLWVGDGDSVSRLPADLPSVVFPRDKDFSDFAGALDQLLRRRVRVVVVAGLLGGRLDHEWANLLEAGRRAKRFAAILAPAARATIVITAHGCRAPAARGRRFSLFALGAAASVSLTGARWPLDRRRLRSGSHGLSNEATGTIDLRVHAGVVALVLPPAARPQSVRARAESASRA